MSPDKMTSLIDDLAGQGVLIAGCDLWRYADREKGWIVQLVGAGFDIGDAPSSVHEAAEKVKRFILEDLPADAELVSLIYFDRSVYEAFK